MIAKTNHTIDRAEDSVCGRCPSTSVWISVADGLQRVVSFPLLSWMIPLPRHRHTRWGRGLSIVQRIRASVCSSKVETVDVHCQPRTVRSDMRQSLSQSWMRCPRRKQMPASSLRLRSYSKPAGQKPRIAGLPYPVTGTSERPIPRAKAFKHHSIFSKRLLQRPKALDGCMRTAATARTPSHTISLDCDGYGRCNPGSVWHFSVVPCGRRAFSLTPFIMDVDPTVTAVCEDCGAPAEHDSQYILCDSCKRSPWSKWDAEGDFRP